MTETDELVIELKDVERTFRQGKVEVQALRGVSFEVRRGEFMALTAPSGAGKTTTLNMIGGLDQPTGGKVILEGRDLSQLSKTELSHIRRDRIGFVFQAYNLIPVLSAYENAELVMALQGRPSSERKQRVNDLLGSVGLSEHGHRRPDELSGGQQQRVAIARAIAPGPAVLLADEPTANVDSVTAENLLDILERMNREQGVTVIFSTHDPRVMERARRIVHLIDGRVDSDTRKDAA